MLSIKTYPNIDYHHRPASYWDDGNVLASLLRDVKGTERREMIRAYLQEGRLEELDGNLLGGTLSSEVRTHLGRIHPMFMGGEYLPDMGAGEAEIARVELRSVTRDVISLRAARYRSRIVYRLVDEYDTELGQPQRTNLKPFALWQLIRFLDYCWQEDIPYNIVVGYNELNLGGGTDRQSLRSFTTIRSEFYPQLKEHYEHLFEEWVKDPGLVLNR